MNSDQFNDLPEWDDERIRQSKDEQGDEWKPDPTYDACKALFAKWQEVVFLLKGIIGPFMEQKEEGDDDMFSSIARELFMDSQIVGVKIKSSEAAGIYVVRMENASIIRKLAQEIASTLLLFAEETDADKEHIEVVRNEIAAFRKLFIMWVGTFEKDEFTDEWGLFV